MSKLIKTSSINSEINTSTAMIIETLGLKFVLDERFPWVDIYKHSYERKEEEYIISVDTDESIVEFDEFSAWVLNWIFENVEVVKKDDSQVTVTNSQVKM